MEEFIPTAKSCLHRRPVAAAADRVFDVYTVQTGRLVDVMYHWRCAFLVFTLCSLLYLTAGVSCCVVPTAAAAAADRDVDDDVWSRVFTWR